MGARPPLIAVNIELATGDLALARRIARETRERDGGLLGVRALGLPLASSGNVQVSMNLVDLETTGIERACSEVRERADLRDVDVDAGRAGRSGPGGRARAVLRRPASGRGPGSTSPNTIEARVGA